MKTRDAQTAPGPSAVFGAATPAQVKFTAGHTAPAAVTGTADFQAIKHLLSGKPLKGVGKLPKKK